MEIKDIMKLIDAGFSKDEIIKLANAKEEPSEPEPKTDDAQTKDKEPAKEPAKEPEVSATEKKLDDIINGLQKVTETMQKSAMQRDRQPEQESVEDILANIINPTFNQPKE